MPENKPKLDEKFAKWRGIDRTEIEWSPNINKDKCIGCGICVTGCGREVFDFDINKNKAVVSKPYQCMVGCTTCQTTCLANAISFPDKEYVRNLITKNDLIEKSRGMVAEKYKKTTNK